MPDRIEVGNRVIWPNGRGGRHQGVVESLADGVGGTCLRVLEDSGHRYYPHPTHVRLGRA